MKIQCHCGNVLVDSTDAVSHKAHLIPDEDWLAIFDQVDESVIASLLAGRIDESFASLRARQILSRPARVLYQCRDCGRLLINDHAGRLHCYLPADDETSRQILRSAE